MKRIDSKLTGDLEKTLEYPIGGRNWTPERLRARRDRLMQIAVRAAMVNDEQSRGIALDEATRLTGVADTLEHRGMQESVDRFWRLAPARSELPA